jgi:hypothetical protein
MRCPPALVAGGAFGRRVIFPHKHITKIRLKFVYTQIGYELLCTIPKLYNKFSSRFRLYTIPPGLYDKFSSRFRLYTNRLRITLYNTARYNVALQIQISKKTSGNFEYPYNLQPCPLPGVYMENNLNSFIFK